MSREINIQSKFIKELAKKGERMDGRKLDEFRNLKIETDVIPNAEGSARVTLGETEVLVGVKMSVGTPFPDTPDKGVLMSGAELHPMSSDRFESGPPREDSIELARVVDRGIREADAINVKKLCIIPGEKVWMVMVDTHIMNHQGNLLDAAGIAAMAALSTTKMPKLDENNDVIIGEKTNESLSLTTKVLPITVVRVGGKLMLDPNLSEEDAMDARLTVSTKDNGNITAMQKGLPKGITVKEVEEALDLSIKKGKELRKLL